jgi:hypothetical protein
MSIKLLCNFNHERVFGQRKIITDSNGVFTMELKKKQTKFIKRTVTPKQYSYEKFIFERCLFESNWLQFM